MNKLNNKLSIWSLQYWHWEMLILCWRMIKQGELVLFLGKVGSFVWVGKTMSKWADNVELYLGPVITEQLRYPPNICSPKFHHLFLCQEIIYWKETPSLNDLDKTGCLLFLTILIRFSDDFLIYPVRPNTDLSPFTWTCWKARGRPSTSSSLSYEWLAELELFV